jgi:hypothetical protein
MRRAFLLSLLTLAALSAPSRAVVADDAGAGVRPRRPSMVRGRGRVSIHPDWASHPSTRYAALESAACLEELGRRGVAFTRVDRAPGVVTPVRLPEGVAGVLYRTAAPAHVRATSPFDVFDCRLALALHDWSALLRAHDVDEVLLFSAYRPAAHARDEGERRHPGGLAIDAYRFLKRRDASTGARESLDVEHDFHGAIGAPSCGPSARPPRPDTLAARELRSILCEAADQHLFTVMLGPGYDRRHRNHLHLELTPDVPWHLVR